MQKNELKPINVPNIKGNNGMSINGDERFMNQFGTNGVILKNIM